MRIRDIHASAHVSIVAEPSWSPSDSDRDAIDRRREVSTILPSAPDADDDVVSQRIEDPAARLPGTTNLATDGGDPDPVLAEGGAPFVHREMSGRSREEAARLMERFYGGARVRSVPSSRPFQFRFASSGDAHITLRMASVTGTMTSEVSKLDDYVVTWLREGAATLTVGDTPFALTEGQPVLLPTTVPFVFEAQPSRQNLVQISGPFLDGVASERHGGDVQPLVFRYGTPLPDDAVATWRRAVTAATPVLTDAAATRLVRMETNLQLARTLLDVFPWHTQHVPDAFLVPRLTRVRAAVEFLHNNAHLPITPADAAANVGLHTRSLQNAFQRHLELSPTEYLRRIRLDRVRRDLLEHTPKTATVNDLARAWGFGNLGRFATAYQQRFGEKPNETLRR